MKIDELHADNSTKIYLDKINMLSDTYTPLTNFINKKDPILTEKFCTNYKKHRNLLSIFMKKSKQAHLINILKEIRIILRKHGKESNPYFSKDCSIQ